VARSHAAPSAMSRTTGKFGSRLFRGCVFGASREPGENGPERSNPTGGTWQPRYPSSWSPLSQTMNFVTIGWPTSDISSATGRTRKSRRYCARSSNSRPIETLSRPCLVHDGFEGAVITALYLVGRGDRFIHRRVEICISEREDRQCRCQHQCTRSGLGSCIP
jgi:hypothetical protein